MAARAHGLAREVVGIGRDRDRLEAAVRLGAIDRYEVSDNLPGTSACAEADLIVLCTPVPNIVADLPGVLAAAKPGSVITDVGSVKSVIVDASGGDPRFVGSHPMAGSEHAGIYAATAELFRDATWALTPTDYTDPAALAAVRTLARGVGARARSLTPTLHDDAVALTSHLPHLIAYALMAQAGERAEDNPDLPFMAAGSFAGATRVAGSSPALWQGITLANREALSAALSAYRERLDEMQAALDGGDEKALGALLDQGHRARRRWLGSA